MPNYLYRCESCQHEAEEIRRVSERENALECEKCKSPMKPAITTAAVHFKGTGFYQTDYKDKGK